MSHEWHKGMLDSSSWHGMEEIGEMPDAETMIRAGEKTGAWPVSIELAEMYVQIKRKKFTVPGKSVFATYADGTARALSSVGDRYTATTPEQWRSLVKAASEAGARPTGAFSLREGNRVLATFSLDSEFHPIRNNLLLADSFDGSLKLTAGFSSIRTVCANTLKASMSLDGQGMAGIRHTASLSDKIESLAVAIQAAIDEGTAVRETYERAKDVRLKPDDVREILEKIFPTKDDKGEPLKGKALTRAENKQTEVLLASDKSVNREGDTLASLWNGLTWCVDRHLDGKPRKARGGSHRLDTLLFGTRGKMIQTIEKVVLAYTTDGRVEQVRVSEEVEIPVEGGGQPAKPNLSDLTPSEALGVE